MPFPPRARKGVRMTLDEARTLTARIKQTLDNLVALIIEAYQGEADRVLGYDSWQAYVRAEFPNLPRMERLERDAAAKELIEVAGMTFRDVAATLGVGTMTVHEALKGRSGRPRTQAVQVIAAAEPAPPATTTAVVDLPVRNGTQRSRLEPARLMPRGPERPSRRNMELDWSTAEALVIEGKSLREVARRTGIPPTTLGDDLKIRQIRNELDPGFPVYPSLRNHGASIACAVEPATELIREVELGVARLFSELYELNELDQRRLRRVLEDGLNYLERYGNNEQSGT